MLINIAMETQQDIQDSAAEGNRSGTEEPYQRVELVSTVSTTFGFLTLTQTNPMHTCLPKCFQQQSFLIKETSIIMGNPPEYTVDQRKYLEEIAEDCAFRLPISGSYYWEL